MNNVGLHDKYLIKSSTFKFHGLGKLWNASSRKYRSLVEVVFSNIRNMDLPLRIGVDLSIFDQLKNKLNKLQ